MDSGDSNKFNEATRARLSKSAKKQRRGKKGRFSFSKGSGAKAPKSIGNLKHSNNLGSTDQNQTSILSPSVTSAQKVYLEAKLARMEYEDAEDYFLDEIVPSNPDYANLVERVLHPLDEVLGEDAPAVLSDVIREQDLILNEYGDFAGFNLVRKLKSSETGETDVEHYEIIPLINYQPQSTMNQLLTKQKRPFRGIDEYINEGLAYSAIKSAIDDIFVGATPNITTKVTVFINAKDAASSQILYNLEDWTLTYVDPDYSDTIDEFPNTVELSKEFTKFMP